jgi:hypothetical protein
MVDMDDLQRRHQQVTKLLNGQIDAPFAGVMLTDPVGPRPHMTAYIAAYTAMTGVVHHRQTEAEPADVDRARQIQNYSLQSGAVAGGIFIELMYSATSADSVAAEEFMDDLTVQLAGQIPEIAEHELPIALITFVRQPSGGPEGVVFWYPTSVAPDRLLRRFQAAVRAAYL